MQVIEDAVMGGAVIVRESELLPPVAEICAVPKFTVFVKVVSLTKVTTSPLKALEPEDAVSSKDARTIEFVNVVFPEPVRTTS